MPSGPHLLSLFSSSSSVSLLLSVAQTFLSLSDPIVFHSLLFAYLHLSSFPLYPFLSLSLSSACLHFRGYSGPAGHLPSVSNVFSFSPLLFMLPMQCIVCTCPILCAPCVSICDVTICYELCTSFESITVLASLSR